MADRGGGRTRPQAPGFCAAHRSGLPPAAPLVREVHAARGRDPGGPACRSAPADSSSDAASPRGVPGSRRGPRPLPPLRPPQAAAAFAARVRLDAAVRVASCGWSLPVRALARGPGGRGVAQAGAASGAHPAPAVPHARHPAGAAAQFASARAAGSNRLFRRFGSRRERQRTTAGCGSSPPGRPRRTGRPRRRRVWSLDLLGASPPFTLPTRA